MMQLPMFRRPSSINTPWWKIRSCWSTRPKCASSTLSDRHRRIDRRAAIYVMNKLALQPGTSAARRLWRGGFLSGFHDQLRQYVQIRPHEKGLARSVPVILIVSVDHGAHWRHAKRHRVDDQVAESS